MLSCSERLSRDQLWQLRGFDRQERGAVQAGVPYDRMICMTWQASVALMPGRWRGRLVARGFDAGQVARQGGGFDAGQVARRLLC